MTATGKEDGQGNAPKKRTAEDDGYQVTHPSLICSVASGNERAFDRFYYIYKPLIEKYCSARGLNPHDTEDMIQKIMSAFSQRVQQGFAYDPNRKFKNYMYGITHHIVNNFLRDQYREGKVIQSGFVTTADDDETGVMSEQTAGVIETGFFQPPDRSAEEQEWEAYLKEAARNELRSRVKPVEFQVFSMLEKGKQPQEIAESLNISLSSVYNHKNEADKRYRKILSELRGDSLSYRDV